MIRFRNPQNDYVKEVSLAWLWTLLIGPIYFAFHGRWMHACLSFVLFFVTSGISALIYPFYADKIIRQYYLENGWIEIASEDGAVAMQQQRSSGTDSRDSESVSADADNSNGWNARSSNPGGLQKKIFEFIDDNSAFAPAVFFVGVFGIGYLMSSGSDGDLGDLTEAQVCKAGIAAVMRRPYDIVKLKTTVEGIHYIHYTRPDDQSNWYYRCKLNDNQVIWASNWKQGTGMSGRWRTDKMDGKVFFDVSGNDVKITQRHYDGSQSVLEYHVKKDG